MPDYRNYTLQQLLPHQHDKASWYWLGMAYWENGDNQNGALWLEKTMYDQGNDWSGKATLNLGLLNAGIGRKDEAIRLFELIPNGVMSRLNAGFLYHEGTETKRDTVKGRRLIEEAIKQLIIDDGNDEYLSQHECFRIGQMYYEENVREEAIEYFRKAISRCNLNYQSDRKIKELAEICIERLG